MFGFNIRHLFDLKGYEEENMSLRGVLNEVTSRQWPKLVLSFGQSISNIFFPAGCAGALVQQCRFYIGFSLTSDKCLT